jgi:Asp/Glu/hydantoin racemase
MRIALIHALRQSMMPVEAAFARLWPGAELMNLLDDSLSADLARDGKLTPVMTERFVRLGRYAAQTGVDGIIFTCSAFGPCIETVARDLAPLPVLKPNEAMIEAATAIGGKVGLLATFPMTLQSMPAEFPDRIMIEAKLAEGALAALERGECAEHDRLAAEAARSFTDCSVIALAQFSLARAAKAVGDAAGRPVLTTPESAVRKMMLLLERRLPT